MRTRLAVMMLVILAVPMEVGIAQAQAPKRTLVIGMPVTPPNLPHVGVYIAKELGYFDEEGINVELTGFESGLQSLRGGIAGGLNLVGASSEPVITVISRGAKIRSIFSYAHRLTVVMAAQESIRKPTDLRGKNLGIQEVGAFREVMTRAVLQSAGLTSQDVNYVPVSSAGYIAALMENRIDTAILHIDQAHMARTKKASLHPLVPLWEACPTIGMERLPPTRSSCARSRISLAMLSQPSSKRTASCTATRSVPSNSPVSTRAIRRKS